eukprot:gene17998-27713_t
MADEENELDLDEMHEVLTEGQWELKHDDQLFKLLQAFQTSLLDRMKEVKDEVDCLVSDVVSTHVQVNNTFNSFVQLQDRQFIENRVIDAESDDEDKENDEEEEEEEEVEANGFEAVNRRVEERYTEAVQYAVKALRDIPFSTNRRDDGSAEEDEEDEENEEEEEDEMVAGKAKDVYRKRRLPFIIGTKSFYDDEMAGMKPLSDASDSSTEDSTSDSDSDSSSDDSEPADAAAPPPPPAVGGAPPPRPAPAAPRRRQAAHPRRPQAHRPSQAAGPHRSQVPRPLLAVLRLCREARRLCREARRLCPGGLRRSRGGQRRRRRRRG